MKIGPRCVVRFHYTLTNTAGEVLDASSGGEPLTYMHGTGAIVPGLERAMEGRASGDKFAVEVAAEDGYGARLPELVQEVPRKMFPTDIEIAVGMQFQADSNRGPMPVTVVAVGADSITLDGNHSLAGQALHFAIEVHEVREATVEEVMHGHVHGPGGHHH